MDLKELILIDLGLLIYVTPGILAVFYRLKNRALMFLLNILTGWTGVGWLLVMIWCMNDLILQNREHGKDK